MKVDLRKEHEWLQRLAGEWTFEAEGTAPGEPAEEMSGTETVRLLGEAWAICEMQGGVPGPEGGTSIMTLGYDPQKQRFVGTFVSSMMTHQWIYEGELDSSATSLTLDTVGPSFVIEGESSKYKDRIEIINEDERVLSSHVLGPDGQWREFMRMRYRRK